MFALLTPFTEDKVTNKTETCADYQWPKLAAIFLVRATLHTRWK